MKVFRKLSLLILTSALLVGSVSATPLPTEESTTPSNLHQYTGITVKNQETPVTKVNNTVPKYTEIRLSNDLTDLKQGDIMIEAPIILHQINDMDYIELRELSYLMGIDIQNIKWDITTHKVTILNGQTSIVILPDLIRGGISYITTDAASFYAKHLGYQSMIDDTGRLILTTKAR